MVRSDVVEEVPVLVGSDVQLRRCLCWLKVM